MGNQEFNWSKEVNDGNRFEFGVNWKDFLNKITEENIEAAELSMLEFLNKEQVKGKTFLDIGCGSGIHSLVAKKLQAKVTSFDYDLHSVEATKYLKAKFFPDDIEWTVMQGSVLDKDYMEGLKDFDLVYSWGVLHHTGNMWEAIDNAMERVNENGLFFIAIYNDQGRKSRFWWQIKYLYNKLPRALKKPYALTLGVFFNVVNIVKYTILLKPGVAVRPLLNYKNGRGMNWFNDVIDWIGGFPFEYSTIDNMVAYFNSKGFEVLKTNQRSSLGCNEFLFRRK